MAGSGRIIEGRTAVVPGANFGLQLASALMQVAVDPFDEVDGLGEIGEAFRKLRSRCPCARQMRFGAAHYGGERADLGKDRSIGISCSAKGCRRDIEKPG
jgi:hypothetical protein